MNPLLGAILLALTFGAPLGPQAAAAKASPAAQSETPTQFYMRYRAAVLSATTLDEVKAFWRAAMVKEFEEYPPDQRVDLAAVKRLYGTLADVKVTSETILPSGSSATLALEARTRDQKKVTGTASLVKEDGGWKLVGQESWE